MRTLHAGPWWTRISRAVLIRAEAGGWVEMTGFPYSEEGAITSIALGPLSSERWEPFLLVLSFTRIREKKKRTTEEKKNTHTQSHSRYLVLSKLGAVSRQRSFPHTP
jgi:hypothetical protein